MLDKVAQTRLQVEVDQLRVDACASDAEIARALEEGDVSWAQFVSERLSRSVSALVVCRTSNALGTLRTG